MQVSILPYHKYLNDTDIKTLGGLDNLDAQGFYVYRNKRLMIHGTWFKIKPRQELAGNARIRIDIPNTLDDLWSIDIKKQKAVIPGVLIEQLRNEVSDAISTSKRIHTYKGQTQTRSGSIWIKSVNRDGSVTYSIDSNSELVSHLMGTFDVKTSEKVLKLIKLIELSLPYRDIYNTVAEKKGINPLNDSDNDLLFEQALNLYKSFKTKMNISKVEIIKKICSFEPYSSAQLQEKLMELVNNDKI